MANEEHVKILLQGWEAWDEWSLKRFNSLSDEDMEGDFYVADFSGEDFSGANFSQWDLGGTDFSGANLSGANLYQANFECAGFREANLQGVDLREAELMDATLEDADLRDANLQGIGLVKVNLSKANLSRVNLSKACLQKANLSGADLSGVRFDGTEYDDETVWPEGFHPPPEALKKDYWTVTEPTLSIIENELQIDQLATNEQAGWWSTLKWLWRRKYKSGDEVIWYKSNDELYAATVLEDNRKGVKIKIFALITKIEQGKVSLRDIDSNIHTVYCIDPKNLESFHKFVLNSTTYR